MKRRSGFTLVEILVVLAIISILAALLFPAFKSAQEKGYQGSCMATMQQIGIAVNLYKTDEGRYPSSLAFLLPSTSDLNNLGGTSTPTPTPLPNTNGTGHLRLPQSSLVCPDDDTDSSVPRSSYGDLTTNIALRSGDLGRFVWNYYGYVADDLTTPAVNESDGSAVISDTQALNYLKYFARAENSRYWINAAGPADDVTNVDQTKLPRLANRFAPPTTIIAHCIYHRIPTSNLAEHGAVYDPAESENAKGAKDIILRLDGSAKPLDITQFQTNGDWQKQNF